MIVSTEAVVLSTKKYGDTSSIATLFTLEKGKISIIAKGARKPKSSYVGSIVPLNIIQVNFYDKPGRELKLVSRAETIAPTRKIYSNLEKLVAGSAIAETVNRTQEKESPDATVYRTLLKYLSALNKSDKNPYLFALKFLIEYAEILGFEHDLRYEGNSAFDKPIYLDLSAGGKAGSEPPVHWNFFKTTREAISFLNILRRSKIEELENIEAEKKLIFELFNFEEKYYSYNLDKSFILKSLKLAKEASEAASL